jgi:predicted alpha/beta hydrolase family esterase
MNKTLETKLATMMHYQYELRAGRQRENDRVFQKMLDDPEIAEWMDQMSKQNCVDFTRFS